jgi:hypothetical protein
MPLDLSLSGQLGYAALDEIRNALNSAQKTAFKAGEMATQSLATSKKAETLIGELAKLQPSVAGDKVLRWLEANTSRSFDLVKDPAKAYAEFKQTGIELQDFGGGGVQVVDMRGVDAVSLTAIASIPERGIRDFL